MAIGEVEGLKGNRAWWNAISGGALMD